MPQKTIRLLDGAFQSVKIVPKDDVLLTKVGFTAKFDQLVASALDIKSSLYDADGKLRAGLLLWELETLLFGAVIVISASQGDLFKDGKPLQIDSIKLDDVKVRRLRADNVLRISFTVTIAEIPRELLDYLEGVRKNTVTITVEPASKEREKTARTAAITHGLFAEPKADDEDEDADDDNQDHEEKEAEPGPDEPQELRGAALASWREVNGAKSRRAKKGAAEA